MEFTNLKELTAVIIDEAEYLNAYVELTDPYITNGNATVIEDSSNRVLSYIDIAMRDEMLKQIKVDKNRDGYIESMNTLRKDAEANIENVKKYRNQLWIEHHMGCN